MGRTSGIRKRGDTWEISYYDLDGARQWETIKGTFEKAQSERIDRLNSISKGIPTTARANSVLFEALAADVIDDYQVNGYKTLKDQRRRFDLHIIPVFGRRKAASITTAQLKAYILRRRAETPTPSTATINRELELIRHTFKLAMDGRKLFSMPKVPHLQERNTRKGFLSRPEVEKVCSFLKTPFNQFVMFGFLTGWRRSEIQGLEWRNVDFDSGEIRIDTSKNGDGRVFHMTDELRAMLDTLKPDTDELRVGPVFKWKGRSLGPFRKRWARACYRAGLPCTIDKDTGAIDAQHIFHDLRRSAAREMQRKGLREGVIMQLMGHKTRSMFDRYNVVSAQDLRDAAEKLNGGKLGGKTLVAVK